MKVGTQLKMTAMRILVFCLFLFKLTAALAVRNDVLIIVNDNSIDSPQIGNYYAQQRDIDPTNIVHVNVPDSYFISWDDFRSLRDQLIRFMQLNTLDAPALTPEVCTDGEPPYYCSASMDQLRAHTKIRYLVTTRGVPTRMTVDGSTLFSPNAPTSVDNYLKYWLINYFSDDVKLAFNEREIAFGDGRSMRTVQPAIDRELIVGRIDGLDLNAARELVDRAIAVESTGIYGNWYGSTKFWSWKNANTRKAIYPKSGRSVLGWRYALGLWGEDRGECFDYLNFSGFLTQGKAPTYCRVQFNDDNDPALQTNQGVNYSAPGSARSRIPQVIDALGYQGWLDGQASLGSFATLLNWRKNTACTVTLCDNAADPAACQANSSDFFSELNTDCVGVADGFMAYNHSSYPVSYLTIWPTNWFQSTSTGSSGWNDGGHGDVNQLAFPEVRNDEGFDDNHSLWFRNTDQVVSPLCYASSDFSEVATVPCVDQRRVVLSQKITLTPQVIDLNSPQTYRVSLRYRTSNIASTVTLRARFFVHETGTGNALIDYGVQTLASLTPVDTGWTSAEVLFTLDPLLHSTNSYDGIKITFDTPNAFAGDLGIDVVSIKEIPAGSELVSNGSFSQGHRQVASGDHAATFLNRLGGVATWGSVSHHQSGGSAFASNGLESMVYFLRGLPLGDAVWFNESNNSGLLYGDPLYSPVSVRLNPFDNSNMQNGSIDLFGNTVNGRDLALVSTDYRIDVCPGNDFYICDQAKTWQATGITGAGGSENSLLGSLDTSLLPVGDYTLRLQVTSLHNASGRSQTIADYYTVDANEAPTAFNFDLNVVEDIAKNGFLSGVDTEGDALTYSIVSNGAKGTVVLTSSTTGLYLYTPNPNATGSDSFTYKVNDGLLDSNIATITVNIIAVNDLPVANAGTLTVNEDITTNSNFHASDIDGDSLTYNIITNATKGSVVISNVTTGTYTYTPNANATGSDSFTFKANDGQVESNIATVSVNITAVNDAPVAKADTLNITEDTAANGSLSASDIEGSGLNYSLVSNGSKGSVVIINASTGAYIYTPNTNATGADSFSFVANDGQLNSDIATVSLNIAAVNDEPVATNVSFSMLNNASITGSFKATDVDGDRLVYSVVSDASLGVVVVTGTLKSSFTYTPNPGATGTDSFSYSVSDGKTTSNIAIITIQLENPLENESGDSGGSLNMYFFLLLCLLMQIKRRM